jgi:lysyl-tRNA synthetase class 2
MTAPTRARLSGRTTARLLGLAVAGAGALNIGSAITPGSNARVRAIENFMAPGVTRVAAGTTALLGITLLLLGRGIVQQRRFAHRVAIVLLILSSAAHVLKGLDYEEAVADTAIALLLIRTRSLFIAWPEPGRLRKVARAIPVIVALDFAYGIAGLYVRRGLVTPRLTFTGAVHEVANRLGGLGGHLTIGHRFGHWFPGSLTVLGWLSALIVLMLLFAPSAVMEGATERERDEVRRLAQRPGGDTLDPFALRHDKRYVFCGDRRAVVAYRCVNGCGLASGDPVGAPEAALDALRRFVALCGRRGWRPAVVGAREELGGLYEQVGLQSFYIGEEAVLDVASFSLEGRRMRPVRQAVSRTRNFGVTTDIHREGELDPTLRRALQGIADRARAGAPERGFTMALDALLSGRDDDCLVVVCRDAGGAPIAFQRYVPCRAGRGLSLDAMRRDAESPNGVNERMIVEAVEWARTNGVSEVSLNFAAFKGLIEDEAELGPMQSTQAWVLRRLNPYFQIESLYRFNAKFHPRWVRRAVMYRAKGDLVPIALATLSAEAFLPFDRHKDGDALPAPTADDEPAHAHP